MISDINSQKLLRKTKDRFITVNLTSSILNLDENRALEQLIQMEATGYLEKIFDGVWHHSLRGKVLANKHINKYFRIETQKLQLNNLLKRIQIINSSLEYPYAVERMIITSEFPITKKADGIFIAYSLNSKRFSSEMYNLASETLRNRHHGNFGTIVEFYSFPQAAVKIFLKSKSPVLKLRQYDTKEIQKIDGHILFQLMPVDTSGKVRKVEKD
ncbi:hypothetical protein QF042_003627 [Pedobacter sp. W3I1]|uniref:hypothetical protein n=1 Tax=Pedobacter sp. W3I1 TaxID=3042291 RepID=UPI0027870FE4|nr:hypothetical protein [Pedobacter sp. W3I1]MDQ0640062.1 hypothetical protein [Pedobacter sp. W3I1]